MSDDLVKRLREDQPVTQDMGSTMQCALQDAAADRIEGLEAKLADAVAGFREIIDVGGCFGTAAYMANVDRIARATITKLKGGKDE